MNNINETLIMTNPVLLTFLQLQMKIMSSKFNRTYVSQVPELCYDGWGLTLPSTLYQELIMSKPFSQLVASVRAFVKSRDAAKKTPTRVKLEALRKKKAAQAKTTPVEEEEQEEEVNGDGDEDELEEDDDDEDEDDDDGTLFDDEDNAMFQSLSTTTPDSQEYVIQDSVIDDDKEAGTAKKRIKITEQKAMM